MNTPTSDSREELSPHAPLRVATWNIHGAARPNLSAIIEAIVDLDVDIVGLQEVRRHQARSIATELGLHCVWVFKHNGYSRLLPRFAEGLAILSRWPLEHDGDFELPPRHDRSDFRRRVAVWATIHHPVASFVVANTHLASHDADERLTQAQRLAELVADGFPCHDHHHHEPQPTVLTGDLNDHDEPAVAEILTRAGLADAWTVASTRVGNGHSNPSERPHQRIDHVMVPREWIVDEAAVPNTSPTWVALSDHLPVTVRVQIRSK